MQRGFLGGLLGAAAGIAFVSGAQAADLPVKAKPVEYVKVCSAYGAGFYYIPGTDICLRVGGYVYVETGVKARAGVPLVYNSNNVDGFNLTRNDNYVNWRSRGTVILDARNNTAYGTLRTYVAFGADYNDNLFTASNTGAKQGAVTAYLERAFIQIAGFTFGFTESFYSFGAPGYTIVANPSVPWDWTPLLAYTANLGNGVTASVSIENGTHARGGISTAAYAATAAGAAGAFGAANTAGNNMPDIAGNINVTQAWGSAQVMAAVHEVRTAAPLVKDTEFGWALGAGIDIKTPQTGAPNNSFRLQGSWTKGYIEKTGISSSPLGVAASTGIIFGAAGPVGHVYDAWFDGTNLHLTEAWSMYAAYRHYWTPALRTSFAFAYTDVDPGGALAVNNQPDWSIWQGNVSTVWSPVSGLDLSLDLVYTEVETDTCVGAATRCNQSEGIWSAWTRIRRNF